MLSIIQLIGGVRSGINQTIVENFELFKPTSTLKRKICQIFNLTSSRRATSTPVMQRVMKEP